MQHIIDTLLKHMPRDYLIDRDWIKEHRHTGLLAYATAFGGVYFQGLFQLRDNQRLLCIDYFKDWCRQIHNQIPEGAVLLCPGDSPRKLVQLMHLLDLPDKNIQCISFSLSLRNRDFEEKHLKDYLQYVLDSHGVANNTPVTILDLIFSGESLKHLEKALCGRKVNVINAYDFDQAELLCEGGIRYFIDADTRFCRCTQPYIPSPPPYPPTDMVHRQVVGCNILLYLLASDSFSVLQASRVFHNIVVRFLGRSFQPGMLLRQGMVCFDPYQYKLIQVDHDHMVEDIHPDAGLAEGLLKGTQAVQFTCGHPTCIFVNPQDLPTKVYVPIVSLL